MSISTYRNKLILNSCNRDCQQKSKENISWFPSTGWAETIVSYKSQILLSKTKLCENNNNSSSSSSSNNKLNKQLSFNSRHRLIWERSAVMMQVVDKKTCIMQHSYFRLQYRINKIDNKDLLDNLLLKVVILKLASIIQSSTTMWRKKTFRPP